MAGKRAAAIAFGLVDELAERLTSAGVPADRMPSVDAALDQVWPLALRMAKLEKAGKKAGKSARRAREAVLGTAVTHWTAATRTTFAEFDPAAWHVALVPGPAADREREAA